MRKIKTKILSASLLLLMLTAVLSSCKKAEIPAENLKVNAKSVAPPGEDPEPPGDPMPQGPSIEELKNYMSSQVNVGFSEISYDENSQQFFVDGLPQISLDDLSKSYEQNNVNGIE